MDYNVTELWVKQDHMRRNWAIWPTAAPVKAFCVSLSHQETTCSPCVCQTSCLSTPQSCTWERIMVPSLFEFISRRSLWWRHFHFGRSQDTSMIARLHFLSFCLQRIQSVFDRMWLRQIFLSPSMTDPAFTKSCEWSSTQAAQSILSCEQKTRRAVGQLICLSCVITFGKLTSGIDTCWFGTAQHSSAQLSSNLTVPPVCQFVSGDISKNANNYDLFSVQAPNKTVDQQFLYPVNNSRQCSGEHILSVEGTTVFVYWYLV